LGKYGVKWNRFSWLRKGHDGRICKQCDES
jgi:hypothetical protein